VFVTPVSTTFLLLTLHLEQTSNVDYSNLEQIGNSVLSGLLPQVGIYSFQKNINTLMIHTKNGVIVLLETIVSK